MYLWRSGNAKKPKSLPSLKTSSYIQVVQQKHMIFVRFWEFQNRSSNTSKYTLAIWLKMRILNKETTRLCLSTNFILFGYTSLFCCLNFYLSTYSCKRDLFPERGKKRIKRIYPYMRKTWYDEVATKMCFCFN